MLKTVTFFFKEPINVTVEVDAKTSEQDILSMAKRKLIQQLTHSFPPYTYVMHQGGVQGTVTIKVGQIVKVKSYEEIGIVIGIRRSNNYPLRVRLLNGDIIGAKYHEVELQQEIQIDDLFEEMKQQSKGTGSWNEGDIAYYVVDERIVPVVFGRGSHYYYHAIPISTNADGNYYRLTVIELSRVFSTRMKAKEYLLGQEGNQ